MIRFASKFDGYAAIRSSYIPRVATAGERRGGDVRHPITSPSSRSPVVDRDVLTSGGRADVIDVISVLTPGNCTGISIGGAGAGLAAARPSYGTNIA